VGRTVEMTPDQARAVAELDGAVTARLTGLAGTGKTWLALRLPQALGWRGPTVFAAPTHRACSILTGKAAREGMEIQAVTSWALVRGGPKGARHCQECRRTLLDHGCHLAWAPSARCRCGELDADSAQPREIADNWANVIVDEASMLTRRDYEDLMAQAPGLRRVVLVGDPGQLRPVDREGSSWSSLVDPELPTVSLREIQRQAAGSPIITAAWGVRSAPEGATGAALLPPMPGNGAWAVGPQEEAGALRWALGTAPELSRAVVLADTNAARVASNSAARLHYFGAAAMAPVCPGELVRARPMHPSDGLTKEVIAQVVQIWRQSATSTRVDLLTESGRKLENQVLRHSDLADANPGQGHGRWLYGYALTVHAAQGSEFKYVIQHVGRRTSREAAYTGFTRATDNLVAVVR
jgi:hypothetical protein